MVTLNTIAPHPLTITEWMKQEGLKPPFEPGTCDAYRKYKDAFEKSLRNKNLSG